jgi:SAM-dependent methyltransferase
MSLERALQHSREYFTRKITLHGPTPQGVDYNGPQAQLTRFEQLVKVIDPSSHFDLMDFGCGYGALLEYLSQRGWDFSYYGFDVLSSMADAGRRAHKDQPNALFTTDESTLPTCDYVIAGAIFNNKFQAPVVEWRDHTLAVLDKINSFSRKGMAFYILSIYSDADRMAQRPDLYFADPLAYFDHCKRNYSKDVALLHDYGLTDFTILVRKQA